MRSKRHFVALMAAAMLATSVPSAVFAESVSSEAPAAVAENNGVTEQPTDVAVSKDKAVSLARELVQIPKEYKLQSASYYSDVLAGGKRGLWGLDFVYQANGKTKGTIYVRINADNGQLVEFSTYVDKPNAKPSYPLKVEREGAQDIAISYINKVAAAYKDQVQYNPDYGVQLLPPLTGDVRHTIRYDRVVNGVPYYDNFIELEVDSEGHVMRYTFNWDDTIQFPKAEQVLSLQDANAKLSELAEPQLSYIIPYGAPGGGKPSLSYEMGAMAIDAVDGKIQENPYGYGYGYYGYGGYYGYSGYAANNVSDTPVSETALGNKPIVGNLTEKEAVAKVEASFKLPEGAEFRGSNYYEYANEATGEKMKRWSLDWTIRKDNQEIGSAYANVDSQTGVINNFYSYQYNGVDQEAKPTVTFAQAKSTALETIKKQLPWLSNELYLVEVDEKTYNNGNPMNEYYFNFVHKVHGATVTYDYINVSIDGFTGNARSFDAQISNHSYSTAAPKLITEKQAIEKWLTYYRTQLTYQLTPQYVWDGQPLPIEKYLLMIASGEIKPEEVEYKTEAKLVYRLVPRLIDEAVFLDAETGNWRNRETGDVTQLEKPKATDINGHWAQRQLELMVAYKALDVKDGKVNPNAIVTRGELIKMLVLSLNGGRNPYLYGYGAAAEKASFSDVAKDSSYYAYVENALQNNWIDIGDGSFNPDGKVDREEMAELIVRALGYNTLANHDELFNISFKDTADIEKKGQAAIVVGLKIMSLSSGKFLPDKEVTRAEAATAFFRFLQARADLQEAPLTN
ncbi:S-layer homology domain-containing protein [Paenibacillus sp. NEAU-GSW1]|uniref:S-layer homology domain-containing protein n=1 Tax=Paenibacillus sp. NEAU-GSW1 TaxID=2682486 RepID=UPI0012E31C37|nr:S-layer homology domain-containing protein [Paenibacillus sp. NEAU-GSW1]MUT65111.1 hypothetical protein [Paenibacillus sp. NEAU-GSW1]